MMRNVVNEREDNATVVSAQRSVRAKAPSGSQSLGLQARQPQRDRHAPFWAICGVERAVDPGHGGPDGSQSQAGAFRRKPRFSRGLRGLIQPDPHALGK